MERITGRISTYCRECLYESEPDGSKLCEDCKKNYAETNVTVPINYVPFCKMIANKKKKETIKGKRSKKVATNKKKTTAKKEPSVTVDEVLNDFKNQEITVENTNELPETQKKIIDILDGMKDLLLYKNTKYGDSAINPEPVWYKGSSTDSILIRLNDKQSRIKNNPDKLPRVNDVADMIGYLTLLLISMGVTAKDLEKFKD